MSYICQPKYFKDYTYPGDRVAKSCELFVEDWEIELENTLTNREDKDPDKWADIICSQSKSCRAVDPMDLKKPKFFMDGVQQDPGMMTMGYGSGTGDPEEDKIKEAERQEMMDYMKEQGYDMPEGKTPAFMMDGRKMAAAMGQDEDDMPAPKKKKKKKKKKKNKAPEEETTEGDWTDSDVTDSDADVSVDDAAEY